MKSQLCMLAVITVGISVCSAQVASHAPTMKAPSSVATPAPSLKPAVRVNGAVLTEADVVREMYTIFPYGRQHNGFPKEMEADIRKGAVDMITFEELLYQEAKRLKVEIPPERLARAEAAFRKQFPQKSMYDNYVRTELNGSTAALREKIRRSLLIEQMIKTEVAQKSRVTLADAKDFYDKNPAQFIHGETLAIQTISIIPPANGSPQVKEEARLKIKDILRLARNTKSSREFGLLAEQLSDDDWRTKLGDRGTVDVAKLPPEVVKAAQAMKPGSISDIIQLGHAYVVFRLNVHKAAGKSPFAEVKTKLLSDMQKQKTMETRSALNKRLRSAAKIEVL